MFQTARLKLTAWYLLIIMTVSLSFSAVIYRALTIEVERFGRIQRYRIEHRMRNDMMLPFDADFSPPMLPVDDPQLIDYVKRRMLTTLTLINSFILILSGLLGYILAGRTLAPIKNMVDEQNRFITDASHELRTPLTALKASLEVNLRDKNLTLKSAKTLIRDSIGEVNALQSLSDSLLTLAQYQNNSTYSSVAISEILSDAIRRVKPLAEQKHITIAHNIQDATVSGDQYGLTEVFMILLDNAVKYSQKSKEITVIANKKDSVVNVSFMDTGVGIAKKDLPYIFDRFYRADSSRARNGYGLGLSIAKKIIAFHHGSITVESKPGKGSTFTVTLPINRRVSA